MQEEGAEGGGGGGAHTASVATLRKRFVEVIHVEAARLCADFSLVEFEVVGEVRVVNLAWVALCVVVCVVRCVVGVLSESCCCFCVVLFKNVLFVCVCVC